MAALICGSLAYDTIMVFDGRFRDLILSDRVHILNVAFLVPEMRREFGGCAGNIAYSLKLLGAEAYPMGTVGRDFGPYAEWLDRHGISRRFIKELPDTYTAQAYITTDLDNNQITSFHPGAMNHSHQNVVPQNAGITIGVVAPDGRFGMIAHAEQFHAAGIPFLFDPGQGIPLFNGAELLDLIDKASWVAVNDYESQLLEERTGLSLYDIAARVEALIVTWGAKGSVIYTRGSRIDVPAVPAPEIRDPTGCGDAYRAGLLYGIMHGYDWETTGNIAALLGAIKIGYHGTQNHRFTPQEFWARYEQVFGSLPEVKAATDTGGIDVAE
ncbi:MAG TPA: carbohydrate kinase family protein [Gammaproteobacteria bacterium]|nr:carbohydrate kinase family protein [Gammaproteobacteria bacterium]